MKQVAEWFDAAATSGGDTGKLEKIRREVADFTKKFPLPHLDVSAAK